MAAHAALDGVGSINPPLACALSRARRRIGARVVVCACWHMIACCMNNDVNRSRTVHHGNHCVADHSAFAVSVQHNQRFPPQHGHAQYKIKHVCCVFQWSCLYLADGNVGYFVFCLIYIYF